MSNFAFDFGIPIVRSEYRLTGELTVKMAKAVEWKTSCIVCGAQEFKDVFEGRIINNHILGKCEVCGMVQAFAINSLASVDYSEYGDYLFLSDSGILRRIHFVKRNMRWKFKFLKDRFRNPVVLDFGSGAGYFCKAAEESGLNAYGVELSDKLIGFSKAKVKFHNIFKSLDEVKVKLDAVFMSDVIEHLDPEISREIMQKVIALLKPEGYLIGNTPNFRSVNIMLCKDRDPVVAPPSHVGYFTPMTLDRYLSSLGLKRTQLYSSGLSSNSFFRKRKFERSFMEKGLREARVYEFCLIIVSRIVFGLAGVLVRPFGMGYQIHFIYQKT